MSNLLAENILKNPSPHELDVIELLKKYENSNMLLKEEKVKNKNLLAEQEKLVQMIIKLSSNGKMERVIIARNYQPEKYSNLPSYQNIENAEEIILPRIDVIDTNATPLALSFHRNIKPNLFEIGRTAIVNSSGVIERVCDFYDGGDIQILEQIRDDGSLFLRGDAGSNPVVCQACSQIDINNLKVGDNIRFIGTIALENLGQTIKYSDLIYIPEKRETTEMVGFHWQYIFQKAKRRIDEYHEMLKEDPTGKYQFLEMAFAGPPGLGKTIGSKIIAYYATKKFQVEKEKCLMVPKVGEIYNSYLNGSQLNVVNMFNQLKKTRDDLGFVVLLLDEFDQFVINTGHDPESEWKRNNMNSTWKEELEGVFPLTNVFIIATLNDGASLPEAIARRFKNNTYQVRFEPEVVPDLISNILSKNYKNNNINIADCCDTFMHFFETFSLGHLQFSDKHYRDFYPKDICSYADIETVIKEALSICRYEKRVLFPNDTVFSGKDFFIEKSKRIRVGIDNEYYRSNAREMFTILSSEDLSKLDKVTVYHDGAKGRKIDTLNSENVEDL